MIVVRFITYFRFLVNLTKVSCHVCLFLLKNPQLAGSLFGKVKTFFRNNKNQQIDQKTKICNEHKLFRKNLKNVYKKSSFAKK